MQKLKITEDGTSLPQTDQKHMCSQCSRYELVLEKYKNLVELLNRKISQLTRRPKTQLATGQFPEEGEIRTQRTSKTQKAAHRDPMNISEQVNLFSIPTLQETDEKPLNGSIKEEQLKWRTQTSSFWKNCDIVNTLTSEIMQLKSNFMHVRQCIYSIFQQANIWPYLSKTKTGFNMALVLFNIFEFSEQEREEMCRLRKIKARRIKTSSKQNVFVTLKRI